MNNPSNIKVVSVGEILTPDCSWEESFKIIKEWCKANDATYYGKPKEDFFIYEAKQMAIKEGKSTVVVEDLS